MTVETRMPSWAPKVSKAKILRLYTTDAQGIVDEELINEVGWALWSRCDSILTVTAAHYGRLLCPSCSHIIDHEKPWLDDEFVICEACGWKMLWAAYHQTYRGKQLFGANAVDIFEAYYRAFPQTHRPHEKMVFIDQLIHAFHHGLNDIGRPVAANLIEGKMKEVIQFLDALTSGDVSATGLSDSRKTWRQTFATASWSKPFIEHNPEPSDNQET